MAIYEVHLGSWRSDRGPRATGPSPIAMLAERLIPYVKQLGYTHVELLPITSIRSTVMGLSGHRLLRAYQPLTAPRMISRLLSTALHQAGIGVILDWVPAHFPKDDFGLVAFDGTRLYEYDDPPAGRAPRLGHRNLQLRA